MSDLDLKALWQQSAPEQAPAFDLAAVKARAERFEARVRRRNRMEWLAGAVVFLWFGYHALVAEAPLLIAGNAVIALSAVGLSLYLWRYGRVRGEVDMSLDACAYVEAQAQTLDAQAKLLAQAPLWYVAPLALGMAVRMAASMPTGEERMLPWMLTLGFVATVFTGVAWLNVRGARALRREAAELRAEGPSSHGEAADPLSP